LSAADCILAKAPFCFAECVVQGGGSDDEAGDGQVEESGLEGSGNSKIVDSSAAVRVVDLSDSEDEQATTTCTPKKKRKINIVEAQTTLFSKATAALKGLCQSLIFFSAELRNCSSVLSVSSSMILQRAENPAADFELHVIPKSHEAL
jgi:hypothetical protein